MCVCVRARSIAWYTVAFFPRSLCQINWMNMNKLIQNHKRLIFYDNNCTNFNIKMWIDSIWFVWHACVYMISLNGSRINSLHGNRNSQGAPAIVCKYWFLVLPRCVHCLKAILIIDGYKSCLGRQIHRLACQYTKYSNLWFITFCCPHTNAWKEALWFQWFVFVLFCFHGKRLKQWFSQFVPFPTRYLSHTCDDGWHALNYRTFHLPITKFNTFNILPSVPHEFAEEPRIRWNLLFNFVARETKTYLLS